MERERVARSRQPELNQAASRSDVERLFRAFRSLGKLQKYEGSHGQTVTSHDLKKGTIISGTYIAQAQFEAGPAQIKIGVIKHGEQWQISGLPSTP